MYSYSGGTCIVTQEVHVYLLRRYMYSYSGGTCIVTQEVHV